MLNNNKTKITIVGAGYVGMSLSLLLATNNDVTILEKDKKKIDLIKQNKSPIKDSNIEEFWRQNKLKIKITESKKIAFKNSEYVVICTPTDYDEESKSFDTSSVTSVVSDIVKYNVSCPIIIKSTVPVGYTADLRKKLKQKNIFFSPEFLREGKALNDNLCPSRIIVGPKDKKAIKFARILVDASEKKDVPTLFMSSTEAEAVKLFSNSYLAMRVSFFNELDSYCMSKNLNSKSIIDGVCLDPRIGNFYNNPSFGYGGYCLPKDSKQLLANYKEIPQSMIEAVVTSNVKRKDFIVDEIIKLKPKTVGIFLLSMKKDSDNFRFSSILDILKKLKDRDIEVLIYEPSLKKNFFLNTNVIKNINYFKSSCDLIIANRNSQKLKDVKTKVFTRDLFNTN